MAMRYLVFAGLPILALMASGCTADLQETRCGAASSYVAHELSNADGEKLVYGSDDDASTFDITWISEGKRAEMISSFVEEPWIDVRGRSIWQGADSNSIGKTTADSSLLRKLFETGKATNAVQQCPSVRKVLNDHRIDYGEGAVRAVSAIEDPNLGQHSKTIADVYLPIVSDDGQSAVLLVSRSWAPLAGAGVVVKIERQDNGEWTPTRVQQIWVS
ncbi:hypothetical protein [Erythrobacter sp. MTPC3]|uniref:hypothetical protein n=1 Tax=Erythrobacter sp. MTPC3 TaxID=3056564 RepID=UPI0036F1E5C1